MEPHQVDQILRQLSVLQAHQDTLFSKILALETRLVEAIERLTTLAERQPVALD